MSVTPTKCGLPVLIVGGGPVGMFAALLLSKLKVPCVLVEKSLPLTATNKALRHPKAHVLHTRSMEIFRQVGLEQKIWERAPPVEDWRQFRYCSSLLGKTFAKINHFETPEYRILRKASPCRLTQFSQPLLEDILFEELNNSEHSDFVDMRFQHEFKAVHGIDEYKVAISCLDLVSGNNIELLGSHVIAADGSNSMVRTRLGTPLRGERDLESFASIHFTSPSLGRILVERDESSMLSFVFNRFVIAVVVAHDVRKGNFVIQAPFFPPLETSKPYEDNDFVNSLIDHCVNHAHKENVPYKLESVKIWGMHATRVDSFSELNDKVFFVGDAAHQFPPSGGFGLNVGLADAHNLVWKLALAKTSNFKQYALKSYGTERKPVCEETINVAVDNYRRGLIPAKVLGLDRSLLSSSMSLFDSSSRTGKTAFRALQDIGKVGLEALDHGYFPDRINHLKNIVETKRLALPLLFPEVDLGIQYNSSNDSNVRIEEDIVFWNKKVNRKVNESVRTSIQVGALLPHVYLRTPKTRRNVSILDICSYNKRFFMIGKDAEFLKFTQDMIHETKIENFLQYILITEDSRNFVDSDHSFIRYTSNEWASLADEFRGVLVRPDQHVLDVYIELAEAEKRLFHAFERVGLSESPII